MPESQFPTCLDAEVTPVALRAGQANEAGAVGTPTPTISWRLEASRSNVEQVAYEVEAAADANMSQPVGSTGWLCSGFPGGAALPGAPLSSREVRWARVRVRTKRGQSRWSAPLRIEAALLDDDDWLALPISPLSNVDRIEPGPAMLVRKTFSIDAPIASARLFHTALGVHDAWINGARVGDAELDPGWTAYQRRLLYAVHDVTHLLQPGENVIAARVGDGWWRGNLTWMARRAVYGATTAFLAQLEIVLETGARVIIATDRTWRGGYGDIVAADLYDGCTRDFRRDPMGWRHAGFEDAAWEHVDCLAPMRGLELRAMAPVRVIERINVAPVRTGNGYIIDARQNLAGYVGLRVRGRSGSRVEVRHAEVLDDEGCLYTEPLRSAKAADTYVLADERTVELQPAFTFHGFRYAEITCSDDVHIETAEVAALSSDLEQTGLFACSDARLNQLYSNVRWSQLANFLALPTDCPQRDERLGWTGDIQVFAPTACMNADAHAFLSSWLRDLEIEQRADGCVPSTIPNVLGGFAYEYAGVGWGDAATFVPWTLFKAYGDVGVLEDQFASMCAWVDYCMSRLGAEGVWLGDFHLGDWLDPAAPPDKPDQCATDRDYIATAYLSASAGIVAAAAGVLGRGALATRYRALGRDIAAAAWRRWGKQALQTQTGCAIAIAFDIAPDEEKSKIGRELANLIRRADGRISAGFLGTPLLLPALTQTGQIAAAYQLLLNERCPGWLYQVNRGASTIWERWDAIGEDGAIHAGEMAISSASMTSFNHYAYGAVAAWLYETVAGIAQAQNSHGFQTVRFAPQPGGGLSWARASLKTPFGVSAIAWSLCADGALKLELTIAPGACGVVSAPEGWVLPPASAALGSGRHVLILAPQADAKRAD